MRKLQYFYRNTSLENHSFDYHGEPIAILKGRLIGVALLGLYYLSDSFDPTLGLAAFAVFMLVMPWLVQRSLRFKLHNSSYRGLRFRFDGSVKQAYQAFLLWPLVAYLTLGLLAAVAHQRMKAFQHGNSRYGNEAFAFQVRERKFFRIYFKMLGLVLLLLLALVVLGIAGGGMVAMFGQDMNEETKKTAFGLGFALILVFYLAAFLFIGPWFSARIQNLVWNGTALGPHQFFSAVRARDLFWIYLTNFIAIVLTLGLFTPFADVRLAKYRLEHMGLNAEGALDDFLAGRQQAVNAMGEETAEVFDFDISF